MKSKSIARKEKKLIEDNEIDNIKFIQYKNGKLTEHLLVICNPKK